MIAALEFGEPQRLAGGRTLQPSSFIRRSTLSLSTACTLANGVREQLRRLFSVDAEVELVEPTLITGDAATLLFAEAWIAHAKGRLTDAYVILRPHDARRLLACAFGEIEDRPRTLSTIESQVLERIALALLALCRPLCGTIAAASRETPAAAVRECSTYFEVRASGPVRAAMGFALSREPAEPSGPSVRIEDLHDVTVELRVELARGALMVPALTALRPGAVLRLATSLDDPGTLRAGDTDLATGVCGEQSSRSAFVVNDVRGQSRE